LKNGSSLFFFDNALVSRGRSRRVPPGVQPAHVPAEQGTAHLRDVGQGPRASPSRRTGFQAMKRLLLRPLFFPLPRTFSRAGVSRTPYELVKIRAGEGAAGAMIPTRGSEQRILVLESRTFCVVGASGPAVLGAVGGRFRLLAAGGGAHRRGVRRGKAATTPRRTRFDRGRRRPIRACTRDRRQQRDGRPSPSRCCRSAPLGRRHVWVEMDEPSYRTPRPNVSRTNGARSRPASG